jgi:hypothetical protein
MEVDGLEDEMNSKKEECSKKSEEIEIMGRKLK